MKLLDIIVIAEILMDIPWVVAENVENYSGAGPLLDRDDEIQ